MNVSNTHSNKRDPKTVPLWDNTIEDNLNELINITYTNQMQLLFGISSLKNFTVKHVWLGTIMR